MSNNVYSDLDSGLTITSTGNVKIVTEENSIIQSIKAILSTSPGERNMLPAFGSNLKRFLFQEISDLNAGFMEEDIRRSIFTWEDRITVREITVMGNVDNNSYDIFIAFVISNSGRTASLSTNLKVEI